MIETPSSFALLRHLTWPDVITVFAVLALAGLIVVITRWTTGNVAENLPPRLRMFVLRAKPIIRLLISIITLAIIVPIVIEPNFNNLIILFSSVALLVGFAFEDYGSSLVAGVIVVFENTYQPGD
jgi:small conductance mechanosensitive channel